METIVFILCVAVKCNLCTQSLGRVCLIANEMNSHIQLVIENEDRLGRMNDPY